MDCSFVNYSSSTEILKTPIIKIKYRKNTFTVKISIFRNSYYVLPLDYINAVTKVLFAIYCFLSLLDSIYKRCLQMQYLEISKRNQNFCQCYGKQPLQKFLFFPGINCRSSLVKGQLSQRHSIV